MLAALNRPHEFEIHFKGALRNGCSIEEIRETLLQITIYCGVPAGVEAFRIARRVLAEISKETGRGAQPLSRRQFPDADLDPRHTAVDEVRNSPIEIGCRFERQHMWHARKDQDFEIGGFDFSFHSPCAASVLDPCRR